MTTELRAFERAWLPPSFQFAVVDAERRVAFHSQDHRSLVEFFDRATENDPDVLTALDMSVASGKTLEFNYHGVPQRGYVVPLGFVQAWSLVVFHPEEFASQNAVRADAVAISSRFGSHPPPAPVLLTGTGAFSGVRASAMRLPSKCTSTRCASMRSTCHTRSRQRRRLRSARI